MVSFAEFQLAGQEDVHLVRELEGVHSCKSNDVRA
jgi:hypothetical protein